MGNSCHRCFGIKIANSKYVRSDLTESRDYSIEFENLMINDYFDDLSLPTSKENGAPFTVSSYMKWLSDQERSFMEDEEDDNDDSDQRKLVLNKPSSSSTSSLINKNKSRLSNHKQPIVNNIGSRSNQNEAHMAGNQSDDWRNQNMFCEDVVGADQYHLCSPNTRFNGDLTNEQIAGYFLEELSRDLTQPASSSQCGADNRSITPTTQHIQEMMEEANKTLPWQEEEIDGPELARLVRRMRPRDLVLSGTNRDLFMAATANRSVGYGGVEMSGTNTAVVSTLYNKIHQNLMKGIKDSSRSVTTSDRDNQSSVDLDWEHEPGMNPSLALNHKRTDTEEDLVQRLKQEEEASSRQQQATTKQTPAFQQSLHHNNIRSQPLSNTTQPSVHHSLAHCSITSQTDRSHHHNNNNILQSPLSPMVTDELTWDMEDEFYGLSGDLSSHNKHNALTLSFTNNNNSITSEDCSIRENNNSHDRSHLLSS